MTRLTSSGTRRSARVRCAVYTRKSSEEGLDQEFNSLQAQREACEAFISSQRHEGWVCLPACYDDGGFSGATMDRPALQRLIADISAGRVDTVIVYKIDRLTRSLADFAKIVEILDARGASFVSVTQQFNTTTSMGRLTLNVLLSFAQFEREVIGERAGQPVDLVDHDGVDPPRREVSQQPLQSRPIHRGAGEPAVIISRAQADPAFLPLALDEGLAGLALCLQRIEFLFEPLLGGFAGVDRTANRCIPPSGAFG